MKVQSWIKNKLALAGESAELPLSELEFVLLDVDLTGIDINEDSVLGVAALPMANGGFSLSDLRYYRFPDYGAVSSAHPSSTDTTYQTITDLLTGRVVCTLNPRFVRCMLEHAAARFRYSVPPGEWLDLAAASVVTREPSELARLSYWKEKMATSGRSEFDAVYDVFAMAQLLQAVLAHAEQMGIATLSKLIRNQTAEHWLRPH